MTFLDEKACWLKSEAPLQTVELSTSEGFKAFVTQGPHSLILHGRRILRRLESKSPRDLFWLYQKEGQEDLYFQFLEEVWTLRAFQEELEYFLEQEEETSERQPYLRLLSEEFDEAEAIEAWMHEFGDAEGFPGYHYPKHMTSLLDNVSQCVAHLLSGGQ